MNFSAWGVHGLLGPMHMVRIFPLLEGELFYFPMCVLGCVRQGPLEKPLLSFEHITLSLFLLFLLIF